MNAWAGAGKSSLIAALLRMTEVALGAVLVDGRDVRDVPLRRLRSAIGVVPQTPFLFEGDTSCPLTRMLSLWFWYVPASSDIDRPCS